MLIELSVRNLAIFEDVRVPFRPGLNIVTGETGAGKSILVEAIRLALGEKADPMAVRTGEDEAEASALFDLSGRDDLREVWEEAGFPWEEELVLRRVVPASGRSRSYLNGRTVAQSVLAELSLLLVEMVGQHSVHLLLSRSAALSAVDGFAGTGPAAAAMRRRYRSVAALRRRVEEAAVRGASLRDRLASLDFTVGELSRAGLAPGEEEEIAGELALIRNAAKVAEALQGADNALSSGEHSSAASLAFAAARLREAAAVDPRLAEASERLRALQGEAQDLARELALRLSRLSVASDRREHLEERLSEIRRLKRKYAREVPELLTWLAELAAEREGLDALLEKERAFRETLRREEEEVLREARALSAARREGAERIGPAVEAELARVALEGAGFRAVVTHREDRPEALSASGLDEAELLFAAGPGQELRPVSQTASGGELSRVMLALRNASSGGRGGTTMIFDEIDAGIGGRVAERVGVRLKELGKGAQVVCVTHLPQVAAAADSHLLVTKRPRRGTAATLVKPLSKQDRIEELARMMSGASVTEEARGHARELIERAARE
jgi:DNA repair protein RecN (Recombination protein N)